MEEFEKKDQEENKTSGVDAESFENGAKNDNTIPKYFFREVVLVCPAYTYFTRTTTSTRWTRSRTRTRCQC